MAQPPRRLGRSPRNVRSGQNPDTGVAAGRRERLAPLAAYTQRMNRVLDQIDAHLDAPLEVAQLAEVAHFSPFHFHRVFTAWMGETLGDYLRRRRLEVAAARLAGQRQTPVLHVALSVGFGSGEAFARAFKTHFGQTPSAWRATTEQRWAEELLQQRRKHDQVERKFDQAPAAAGSDTSGVNHPTPTEFPMPVTLATLPPVRIAYLRHIGPYGPSVEAFWRQAFFPWMHANDLAGRVCYGIGHDDPGITAPENCRYDAGVEIAADATPGSPAGVALLPGGRYALADYRGTGAGIGRAWSEFMRDWLPNSGLQIDSRPFFERYPINPDYNPATGEFNCQLCIPVKPL
ncbi:AraC family transcriptional regulator [Dechloromonas sp. ZY10]|uniref:AraC family transcriptional regulator n=1 Tax=Dechloromonas aquae TaxID=2664436 RepID=UPI00352873DE